MNKRKDIRNALKLSLEGNTSAGANVYTSHGTAYWESELPSILITTPEEPSKLHSLQSKRYIRTLEVTIEVRLVGENAEDALDDLLAEIETIMIANPSISGSVISTVQTNTSTRIDSEGESDTAVGVLSFESTYIS